MRRCYNGYSRLQSATNLFAGELNVQLWELLLEADRRLDLADLGQALAWLHKQPWGVQGEWPEKVREHWTRNVLALRSLAVRLKRWRPGRGRLVRKGPENNADADQVAFGYLRLMTRVVLVAPPGGPLTARNFRGVHYRPTCPLAEGQRPTDATGRPIADRIPVEADHLADPAMTRAYFWALSGGDVFWQVVFDGLLADSGPAVCRSCGALLGDVTPTGRHKRQQWCRRCLYKKWYAKQPAEKKRARWRVDYRKGKKGG
jgi:hypothetical protein